RLQYRPGCPGDRRCRGHRRCRLHHHPRCTGRPVGRRPWPAEEHRRLATAAGRKGSLSMCGIVAASARREVAGILLEGLKRLEYRGYDSAGMAVAAADGRVQVYRRPGKVINLETMLSAHPLAGHCGIAHTRWA